jgi:serine O-acetyltransferase
VVLREVPPGATMVGVPARALGPQAVAKETCFPAYGIAPGAPVDPVSRAIDRLTQQVEELNARLLELEEGRREKPGAEPEKRQVAAS